MAKDYADYIAAGQSYVRDKSGFLTNPDDYFVALDTAVSLYQNIKPRPEQIHKYTGDGTRLFSLPSDWDEGISTYTYKVEYPVDANAIQVRYLEQNWIEVYTDDLGTKKLRFRAERNSNYVPATGEEFVLHYSVKHTLTEQTNTIPDSDFTAVVRLFASELCKLMANAYDQQADSFDGGDAADYRDKGDKWQAKADKFYSSALELLVPSDTDITPYGKISFVPTTPTRRDIGSIYPRNDDNSKGNDY